MMRVFFWPLTVLFLLLGGCSAYVEDFQYVPRPALAEVPATTQGQPPPVSVMATVVGVRREDKEHHVPLSIEVRLRLDNNGPEAVTFDPHSLELSNPLMMKFEPPLLQPETPVTLAPAQTALVEASFAFPPGGSYENTDLSSLQLRLLLSIDNRPVRQVITFSRIYPYYYSPYYYGAYPYWWYGPREVFVFRSTAIRRR